MTEGQVPAVPQQQAAGTAVAAYDPSQFATTGLEQFSMSDSVMPRIKINHERGTWGDNLTGMEFPVLRFIVLGLVKQRVLFHPNVEDGDVPMCKSSDYITGYPNIEAPAAKSFPWPSSGFNINDFPPDAAGNRALPCEGCQLKEWGSHPVQETPYCAEQFTMPIYYEQSGLPDDHPEGGVWTPAILTLQKSSIKPIRTYLTPFANSNRPPFLAIGRGTLRVQTRGTVTYSTPSFVQEGESDRSRWLEFSQQFLEMQTYLMRPPVKEPEDVPTPTDNTYTGPPAAAQQAPVQTQPVATPPPPPPPAAPVQQAPAPVAEDPWATPAPQPSADLPPVQPPTPAPAAPPVAPAPVAEAPQAPPVAPPAQPAAPPPPAAPVAAPPEQPAPEAAPVPQAALPAAPPAPPAAPPAPAPAAQEQPAAAPPAAGTELPF